MRSHTHRQGKNPWAVLFVLTSQRKQSNTAEPIIVLWINLLLMYVIIYLVKMFSNNISRFFICFSVLAVNLIYVYSPYEAALDYISYLKLFFLLYPMKRTAKRSRAKPPMLRCMLPFIDGCWYFTQFKYTGIMDCYLFTAVVKHHCNKI